MLDLAYIDHLACNGRSFLHRAPLALRIVLAALLVGGAVAARGLPWALVPPAAGLALLLAARVPLPSVVGLAAYPALLSALFAVSWRPALAPLVFCRAIGAALGLLFLLTTTPYPALFSRLPLLPPRAREILLLTYRSFFALLERCLDAARAVRWRGGLSWRAPLAGARGLGVALAGAVLAGWDGAEATYRAVAMRGHGTGTGTASGEAAGASCAGEEIARVSCIRHFYPDRTEVAICGLDFVLYRGELAMLLGPNGAGKTTLFLHLTGFLRPAEGLVRVFGLEPARHFDAVRRRMGVMFQDVATQIVGPTVRDDIGFGPRAAGWPKDRVAAAVESLAGRLGIRHLLHKVPHYLSGGEMKRVALAGALVMEPELLLLDEPFSGLDPRARAEIAALLLDLNRARGVTVLIAGHEADAFSPHADRIYVMSCGRIAGVGRPAEVLADGDLLRGAGLDVPPVLKLIGDLRARGAKLDPTCDPVAAADQLARLLRLPAVGAGGGADEAHHAPGPVPAGSSIPQDQ